MINKAIYLALGINLQAQKELLGLWSAEIEGVKFSPLVLTELHTRGLRDFFIVVVDGLSGFAEAINTIHRQTKSQLSIAHMVRNTLYCVSWKDRKAVAMDLKRIYQSSTVDEAGQTIGIEASLTARFTGLPEAVTRLPLPQNAKCRFPARRFKSEFTAPRIAGTWHRA